MENYKIKVKIEIAECKNSSVSEPQKQKDGSFEMIVRKKEAVSIDKCERALLETSYPAIRDALSQHLTQISEKEARENGREANLSVNTQLYQVDGEIGRFVFETHRSVSEEGEEYNTAVDIFPELKGKEWYRTTGFKEIAVVFGTCDKSYRKTSALINRIRHQEGATPARTLRDNTEAEGAQIAEFIETKANRILQKNGFIAEGTFEGDTEKYAEQEPARLSEYEVEQAIEAHAGSDESIKGLIINNPVAYENPEYTVNISMDDVGVKEQKAQREREKKSEKSGNRDTPAKEKKKQKYVHNTIVHIQKGEQKYILNGYGIINVLRLLIAFLLHNNLLKYQLLFFIDGHKILLDSILRCFAWFKNLTIILDWYHLEKKHKEQLSLAMKGREVRNAILNDMREFLWYGMVDIAIEYLRQIDKDLVKNETALLNLITYLERNKPYIPCYIVRQTLGLRNSSNIGEKMNDLVVSERQKHNGMSWSRPGSVALASITALVRNDEYKTWFEKKTIRFKFSA